MGNNNQLVLKSINQLFEYSFFIPAYQRGYRWTAMQVKQLLNDVWNFAKNPPQQDTGQEKPFYCLQPIVVKERSENEWEVIDGQQRLTTIFLILKNLENQIEREQKNIAKIYYETRIPLNGDIGSEEYLKNVEKYEEIRNQNIDFYHIYSAFQTVREWFAEKANTSEDIAPKAVFAPILLAHTKVIWYEVEEGNDSIDIFTRLNIGKIPLTNAELIKALFLQKGNFDDNTANIKQIQIASEWDTIEKTLQDDSFWFFIYNPENPIKYDNRIEYVFDLMTERKRDSEFYHTFNWFSKKFAKNNLKNGAYVDKIWIEVKRYFLTFDEWFKDYELFHYVGYLIDCIDKTSKKDLYLDETNKRIRALKSESIEKSKIEFKLFLKEEIKKHVSFNLDIIQYGDKAIRKILLLFNIQTVLATQKSDMRFPFDKYKSGGWDIEHVCSQTDKTISGSKIYEWIDDILEYFVGTPELHDAQEFANTLHVSDAKQQELKEICISLILIKRSGKIIEENFNSTFKLVQKYFNEEKQTEEIHDISNLALLDSLTNRSYGNSFFPIKRKRIIDNDSKGIFVPIATKNLFLKYYSKKLGEVMYWSENDAKDYKLAIKTTLKEFLPKEEKDEQ